MRKNTVNNFLFTAFLLLHFTLDACHLKPDCIPTAENVVYRHLNKDSSVGVLVISDERKGQTWYRVHSRWRVETIKNIPETSLYKVWQVEISPQDDYMAVLSEEEGHPVVEIFEISRILMQRDGLEDEMISPVLTVDPYPGTIWIKGWQNETQLRIDSDMPLNLLDRKLRRVFSEDAGVETREYLWDVLSDTIIMAR